jgi:hypothetical protein
MRGDKNPNWKGGFVPLPYTAGFTVELKARIRERDGNQCRHCGAGPGQNGGLVVHHLDWGKDNHDPSNLVTLCRSCHSSHHHGSLGLKLVAA